LTIKFIQATNAARFAQLALQHYSIFDFAISDWKILRLA
jgi:hypothetical protein